MKKIFITLLLLGFAGTTFAQLNSYKYIVVPKKFEAFKQENLHRTSSLIKLLFSQEGFDVVYDDALPADLANNRCLGAYVDLEKTSKFLSTRIVLNLKDCNSVTIIRSVEGKSKIKEYEQAYHEAIRRSFTSFKGMNYRYKPAKTKEEPVTADFQNDIKTVEEPDKNNIAAEAVVVQVATPEEQYYEDNRPTPSDYTISEQEAEVAETDVITDEIPVFTAKELPNGYELLDSQDKLWLTLYETSTAEVFIAKNERESGMVYKKNSSWYFEYYQDSELVVEELRINF
ncbi:MAG: hypothetical protein ACR2MM_13555 [Flavobacteriaceae bacterium]